MNFFKNKVVKVIAWVVLALCVGVLILGGATLENISAEAALVSGIVSAVSLLIAFICERTK